MRSSHNIRTLWSEFFCCIWDYVSQFHLFLWMLCWLLSVTFHLTLCIHEQVVLFMSPKAGRSHWTDWEIIFRVYYPHALSIIFHGQDVETFFCISSLKAQILLVLYSYYHWCNCSFQPLCYQSSEIFLPPTWATQQIKSQSFSMSRPCTVVFCRTRSRGSRFADPPWSPQILSQHNPQCLLVCLGQNFD